jgi:hypothetical protein
MRGEVFMKKITITLLVLLIGIFCCLIHILSLNNRNPKEYLNILTTVYNNGTDDNDGISMVLYQYDITDKVNTKLAEIPITADYPVGIYDKDKNKIYYSNNHKSGEADNLFEYDLETKKSTQLTFGKFLFNDIFIYGDKLYLNVAREFCTVTQSAVMDLKTNEITYLNPDDDDTWYFSLSYNYSTKKLLSLTTSDTVMRSKKVCTQTHIRPKTIYMMDLDFGNYTDVFSTDEYEIALIRQLDKNRILMTYDPQMASPEPRRMKILYLDSKKTENLDIPGIYEFHSFYPRDNAEGMFFTALNDNREIGFYYYDFNTKELENLYNDMNFLDSHRAIVDFVYTIQ